MPHICLPEVCDRQTAVTMLPDFLASNGEDVLVLDGSAVTQIGQPMLQLILSATRHGAGGFVIRPSDALSNAARIAGVEAELFAAGQA